MVTRIIFVYFHISFLAINIGFLFSFCKIIQDNMALFASHITLLTFLSKGVPPEASPTQPKLQQFIFPVRVIPQHIPTLQAILFTQVNKRSILYSNLCCKICTYITVAVTNALNCLIY